ncbi:MAG: hypothetical protein RL365_1467 [Bacteroidota bacterium]|jgi:hypothetical protein
MKRFLILLTICISSVSFGQVPNYVPTNGLVGWWGFNGNANDESGNGNNGVLVNTSSFQPGYSNEGVFLQGVNALNSSNGGHVEFPNISSSFDNEFTFAYWANLDTCLFDPCSSGGERYLAIGNGLNTLNELSMFIQPPCNNQFGFRCGNNTSNRLTIPFDSLMNYDTWHHISMTGFNGICNAYIDGNFVGSFNGITDFSQFDFTKFYFGRHYFGTSNSTRFLGMFDEFGSWNRALTQCEIQDIYNAGLTSTNGVTQTDVTLTADQNNATYQWIDCDNNNSPILGETNQSFTPTVTGNYAVEVTVNGCTSVSECVLMDFTGVDELLIPTTKKLIKTVNLLGQEVEYTPNTVLIYQYSDGTSEKVFIIED